MLFFEIFIGQNNIEFCSASVMVNSTLSCFKSKTVFGPASFKSRTIKVSRGEIREMLVAAYTKQLLTPVECAGRSVLSWLAVS